MLGCHKPLVNRKFRCIKRLSSQGKALILMTSTARRSSTEDSACLGRIPMKLRDQRLNAAELLGITQTGDEIDSDGGAIEIEIGVEKMRFDHRLGVAKCRTRSEVHHPVVRSHRCLYADGVDPFWWQEFPRTRDWYVRGRESHESSAAGTFTNPATERVTAAEATKGSLEIAAGDCAPDGRRRHGLSTIDRHRWNDADIETTLGTKPSHGADIAGPVVTEAMIVAHEKIVHPEAVEENLFDESLRAVGGERRCEWQHGDEVDP